MRQWTQMNIKDTCVTTIWTIYVSIKKNPILDGPFPESMDSCVQIWTYFELASVQLFLQRVMRTPILSSSWAEKHGHVIFDYIPDIPDVQSHLKISNSANVFVELHIRGHNMTIPLTADI